MTTKLGWRPWCRGRGLHGTVVLLACSLLAGCLIPDPSADPPAEHQPWVKILEYKARLVETGAVLAEGCIAPGSTANMQQLEIPVPLEVEYEVEFLDVGSREGKISDETPSSYFCERGPSAPGASGSQTNPRCYANKLPEVFTLTGFDVISRDGGNWDWESEDDYVVLSAGWRVRAVQHAYGPVAVRTEQPPCTGERGLTFFTAVEPEVE